LFNLFCTDSDPKHLLEIQLVACATILETIGLSSFIIFDVHSPLTPLGRHENGVSSFSPYISNTLLRDYLTEGRSLLSDIAAAALTGQRTSTIYSKFIYLRKHSHSWVLQLIVHSFIRTLFMPLVSDTRGLDRGQLAMV